MILTELKFWIKYCYYVLTFKRIIIDHRMRLGLIVSYDISPEAIRKLQVVEIDDKLFLTFLYSDRGLLQEAKIPYDDIVYFGSCSRGTE